MTILNDTSITIDTVQPNLTIGQIQLSADRRSTKEKPLTDADRIRRAVLPANTWGELSASSNEQRNQGLTDILLTGLKQLASERLKDFLNEEPMARTIPLNYFTITNLLTWSADTAASRGSLTFDRDAVLNWYPTSAIFITMKAKGNQVTEFILQRLTALAAKNHGLKTPQEATKLITLLSDDAESTLGGELIQRLAHIEKALTNRKDETKISLDDL